MPSVIMLNVVTLSVIVSNVVMHNVVLLNVVAPIKCILVFTVSYDNHIFIVMLSVIMLIVVQLDVTVPTTFILF
jgi:hypothetical protein